MQNNKIIIKARSKKNGIVFYSNTLPFVGSETFYDDSGKMQSRLIFTRVDELVDYMGTLNEKENTFNKKNLIIFDFALIIISIIAFVCTKNFGLIFASIYFSVFVSHDLFEFAKISYKMKLKKGRECSIAKFHAAEHMAINAYKKLQRIPTLEEAKKYSRFSKNCGSRKILSRIFMFSMITVAMATLISYNGLIYLIVVLLIPLFRVILEKYGWLIFLQVFVTSKPTDKEIELAIEGLRQFEIMEKMIKNDEELSSMTKLPLDFPSILKFPFV